MNLASKIMELRSKSIMAGINPTELWLGPFEMRSFDAAMTHMTTVAVEKDYKPRGGERIFCGMVVRESVHNGIRVGTTIS